MSIVYPFDTNIRDLIRQAMNSKTLETLAKEEDRYQANQSYLSKSPKKLLKDGKAYEHTDIKKVKKKLSEKTPEEVLNGLRIKTWKSSVDGSKILSKYELPTQKGYWAKNNIDENDLIKDVTTILGTLNLRNSSLESTGSIKTVQDGIVIGKESKIRDLSSLDKVYGLVLVEAKNEDEAKEILKNLNFNPRIFKGKILSIPSPKELNYEPPKAKKRR